MVIGAALLLVLIAGDVARSGWSQTDRLQGEIDRLEGLNAAIASQNRDLTRSLTSLRKNGALLEQAAREDLGYIRDGEVVVVLPK